MKWSDIVPLAAAHFPDRPGLYKLFLRNKRALAGTILAQEPQGALLYIGKAEKEGLCNRHEKQHLVEESGRSSPRRSLGAVLREQLHLCAVPRQPSPHKYNYSFAQDGERCLTEWMRRNLLVSWATPGPMVDLEAEETRLIEKLRPALNILHNRTGRYVREVKRLRGLCAQEMRRKLCGRHGCCHG